MAGRFFADEAMKMLHAAVSKGFKNAAHIMKATDLDSLRGEKLPEADRRFEQVKLLR